MASNPYRVRLGLGVLDAYASNSAYLSATGSTAKRGDTFFNSDKNRYEYYDGSIWRALTIRTNRAVVKAIDLISVSVPSGPQTVDGVSCIAGDLVLLAQNTIKGIYRVETGTWSLQTEYLTDPTGAPYKGDQVMVQESASSNALSTWVYDGTNWITSGLQPGTVTNSTLRWSGTSWVENTDVWTSANNIATQSNSISDASPAQDLFVHGGDKTAGTGDGGNLALVGGSSVGGLVGKIIADGRVLEFGASGQSNSDPLSPAASQIYYNTLVNKFKYYDGTNWRFMSAGTGFVKARLHSPTDTTLPTGNPVTIDGVNVNAGDDVLFSGLSVGNNQIYTAVGTLTNITSWVAKPAFDGSVSPLDGDSVVILEGNGYADRDGNFTGTKWVFNETVRYFNPNGLYFEQDSLRETALNDNQVSQADIFTFTAAGSENVVIDYSIIRGTAKEVGSVFITTDGTNAAIAAAYAPIGSSGITFFADVNAGNLRFRYTSTNTGSSGTIRYTLRRWSDVTSGPNGPVSYSGGGGGGGVSGSGGTGQITFWNGASTIAGNSNFTIDTTDSNIGLGVLKINTLASATLFNNQVSPVTIFSVPHASYKHLVIEYSIVRDVNQRVARLLVTTDGTSAVITDDGLDLGSPGITFSASISGPNLNIRYTSTNTSFNGTFKYSIRKWI